MHEVADLNSNFDLAVEIVNLRHDVGMPQERIAKRLGIPLDVVEAALDPRAWLALLLPQELHLLRIEIAKAT